MQSIVVLNESVHTESGCARFSVSNDVTDPVFQSFVNVNLPNDTHPIGSRTTDYLAHSVARNPNCLLTHAQRIALHVKRKESEAVCGALLDLFIVLGTHGTQLRERMLKFAESLLDQTASEFFLSNLRRGVLATNDLPISPYSVLTKGVHGTTDLVRQIPDRRTLDRDPLQQARECLEFGQVGEAQRILEVALIDQPERVELHHDLLEIYRYTADQVGFNAMRIKLESKNHSLVHLWDNMADSFEDAVKQ